MTKPLWALALVPFLLAAAPAPAPVPKGFVMDHTWDASLEKAYAAIKPGMNLDQVTDVFQKKTKEKHRLPAVYDGITLQDFEVTSTKQRIYVMMNYLRVDRFRTAKAALLVFQAPIGDATGRHSILLSKELTTQPIPSQAELLRYGTPVTVKTRAEIKGKLRYKLAKPIS